MNMETSKLTAEGIIGEAVRIGAKMSGGEFPIEIFPIRIQRIISSLHDCQYNDHKPTILPYKPQHNRYYDRDRQTSPLHLHTL